MAHEIRVPRLGWSMEVGTFLRWLKKEGDVVREGDMIYELEGEKAAQEIEAIESGILRIASDAPADGTEIPVGTLLGYLVADGEAVPVAGSQVSLDATAMLAESADETQEMNPATRGLIASSPSARRRAVQLGVTIEAVVGSGRRGRITRQDVEAHAASPTPRSAAQAKDDARVRSTIASPRARRVARELGVDWRDLQGSGRGARVREADVRAALPAGNGQGRTANGQVPADCDAVPITKMRRVIAQRMVASRAATVPVTLTTVVVADRLLQTRKRYQQAAGFVPSFNDLLLKVVADALLRHPLLAGRWEESAILVPRPEGVHIGLAVDTEQGLLVPVVRDVARRSLEQVAQSTRDLAQRARDGRLSLDELQGGVFTLTNLGAMGIDAFTPVINLPESAILGVGAIRREAIVGDDDQIVLGHRMTLSLTFDHRVVDGGPAARFLAEMRQAIETLT
jgi:pyruvate dehydrogenase E2 component (dihydrolipoamide acetyltransferase)